MIIIYWLFTVFFSISLETSVNVIAIPKKCFEKKTGCRRTFLQMKMCVTGNLTISRELGVNPIRKQKL